MIDLTVGQVTEHRALLFADWNQMKIRLGEARDFFTYLARRENRASTGA